MIKSILVVWNADGCVTEKMKQQLANAYGKLSYTKRMICYVGFIFCIIVFTLQLFVRSYFQRHGLSKVIKGTPAPIEQLGLKIFVYEKEEPKIFNKI